MTVTANKTSAFFIIITPHFSRACCLFWAVAVGLKRLPATSYCRVSK